MLALEFSSQERLQKCLRRILRFRAEAMTRQALKFSPSENRWLVLVEDGVLEGLPQESLNQIPQRATLSENSVVLPQEKIALQGTARFVEFWQVLSPSPWFGKVSGGYWFLLPLAKYSMAVRHCLDFEQFQIARSLLAEERVLLQVPGALSILAEILEEDCQAESFWRPENTDVLHPRGFFHPAGESLQAPEDKAILLASTGLVQFGLSGFRHGFEGVEWFYDGHHKAVVPLTDAYSFTLRLSFFPVASEDQKTAMAQYGPDQYAELEDWIQDLPPRVREGYSVLKTLQGDYFLRIREDKGILPPVPRRSFVGFPHSDGMVYVRKGLSLRPALPASEVKKIFDARPGLLILLDEDEDLKVVCESLESLAFVGLEQLIQAEFVDRRESLEADLLQVGLSDPILDIYDLEQLDLAGFSQREGGEPPEAGSELGSMSFEEEPLMDEAVDAVRSHSDLKEDLQNWDLEEARRESLEAIEIIRRTPEKPHSENWVRLAWAQQALEHTDQAILSAELAWLQGGSEGFDLAVISPWWFELLGADPEETLKLLLEKTGSFDAQELQNLGFALLGRPQKEYARNHTLRSGWYRSLESEALNFDPIRLMTLLMTGARAFGPEEYSILKIRDQILARLFENGALTEGCFPEFVQKDTENLKHLEEELGDLGEKLGASGRLLGVEGFFLDLVRGVHLCIHGQASQGGGLFSRARNWVSTEGKNDPLLKVIAGMYITRGKQYRDQELNDSALLLDMEPLPPSLAYKAELLRSKSLVLQKIVQVQEESNSLKEEFYHLRRRTPEILADEIPRLMKEVNRSEGGEERLSFRRTSLWSMVLRVLPRLGREESRSTLENLDRGWRQLLHPAQQGLVLGRLIAVARLFEREDILQSSQTGLMNLLRAMKPGESQALENMLLPLMEDFENLFNPQVAQEVLGFMERPLSGEDPATQRCLALIACLKEKMGQEKECLRALERSVELYLARALPPQEALKTFLIMLRAGLLAGGSYRVGLARLLVNRFSEIEDRLSISQSHVVLSRALFLEFLYAPAMQTERVNEQVSPETRQLQLWLETRIKSGIGQRCQEILGV